MAAARKLYAGGDDGALTGADARNFMIRQAGGG